MRGRNAHARAGSRGGSRAPARREQRRLGVHRRHAFGKACQEAVSYPHLYIRPAFQEIAREYLEPLRRCDIDTLVLGCTHFPLLKALIGGVVGRDVTLISSAQEAAHDVAHILSRRGALASEDHEPSYDFDTSGEDVEEFRSFGARVFRTDIDRVGRVAFPCLLYTSRCV